MSRIQISSTLAILFIVAIPSMALADPTSKDHPTLKRALKAHPEADADKDGNLTLSEYLAYQKKQRKLPVVFKSGDVLITDFEENNYDRLRQLGWKFEGDSFAGNLDHPTRLMNRRTETHNGRYFLSSFRGSDETIGRVLSSPIDIDLKFIQFHFSGGDHPHRVCVNLLVDGKIQRTITGRNDDAFEKVAFDVTAFRGKQAQLEILDNHRGLWGHLSVDRILQTNQHTAVRVVSKAPTEINRTGGAVLTLDKLRSPLSIAKVNLKTALQVICDNDAITRQSGEALRLVDGQVWHGQILELKDKKVGFQSPHCPRREVPLKQIASFEFRPGKETGGKPGTLYRGEGEPIPCKIVWIRQNDVAIDCELGIVPVPRNRIQRLVVNALQSPEKPLDEVQLIDGNLLRGQLSIKGEELILKHEALGEVKLKWSSIRYLRRASENVVWLDQLKSEVLSRSGPITPPPLPEVIESNQSDYLRAIRMMPKTVVRYKLPSTKGNRVLRGLLAPLPNSRADVTVRVKQGEQKIWEKQLEANGEPLEIAVSLKDGAELTIEVDLRGRIAFPCGVDWRDLHVITK